MSQMKDIARGLAANGAAARADNNGYYLLFTDNGRLVVKHWNGEAFGDEQLVSSAVRPGSAAAYIPALDKASRPLAICVTAASRVAVFQYNEEEEEWSEDPALPVPAVHPSGKLAAALWDGRVHVVFQGADGALVLATRPVIAGSTWTLVPLTTAVQPRIGTALSFSHPDGGDIFYVSAADNRIHTLCDTKDWADSIVADAQVETLKQLFVASGKEKGVFDAFALTEANAVIHIPSGGEKTVTGEVRPDGSYVSKTKAEWSINLNFYCVVA